MNELTYDTPCDYCGQPVREHSIPINKLERLRGEEPPPPPVASFHGVTFTGMLCPEKP